MRMADRPPRREAVAPSMRTAGAAALTIARERVTVRIGMWRTLNDIDWAAWTPRQRATLVFVVRDGQVLLIHKKRGIGAGYINGVGGRLEPGETATEAAVREVREELCISPVGMRYSGHLRFQFLDGLSLDVTVFRADGYTGTPTETEEATPVWCDLAALPYDRMWPDDPLWLPHVFSETPFEGLFLFDDRTMLDADVTTGSGAAAAHAQSSARSPSSLPPESSTDS